MAWPGCGRSVRTGVRCCAHGRCGGSRSWRSWRCSCRWRWALVWSPGRASRRRSSTCSTGSSPSSRSASSTATASRWRRLRTALRPRRLVHHGPRHPGHARRRPRLKASSEGSPSEVCDRACPAVETQRPDQLAAQAAGQLGELSAHLGGEALADRRRSGPRSGGSRRARPRCRPRAPLHGAGARCRGRSMSMASAVGTQPMAVSIASPPPSDPFETHLSTRLLSP